MIHSTGLFLIANVGLPTSSLIHRSNRCAGASMNEVFPNSSPNLAILVQGLCRKNRNYWQQTGLYWEFHNPWSKDIHALNCLWQSIIFRFSKFLYKHFCYKCFHFMSKILLLLPRCVIISNISSFNIVWIRTRSLYLVFLAISWGEGRSQNQGGGGLIYGF